MQRHERPRNIRELIFILRSDLRGLLWREGRGRFAGRTWGHVYQAWLQHGGEETAPVSRIDQHILFMIQHGFPDDVLAVVSEWNRHFVPVSRATRNSGQAKHGRIILQLSHHAEALARYTPTGGSGYAPSKVAQQVKRTSSGPPRSNRPARNIVRALGGTLTRATRSRA